MTRKIALLAAGLAAFAALASFAPRPAEAQGTQQGWFQTGTGLGVSKVRVAVPDFASRSAAAQPLEKTFHDVLWSDLEYCGIIDLVTPSFYPTRVPSQPSELNAPDWAAAPGERLHGRLRQLDIGRHDSRRRRSSFRCPQPLLAARRSENLSRRGHGFRRAAPGAPVCRRHHRGLERRAARHRPDANRLRERPKRLQGNLGHGL